MSRDLHAEAELRLGRPLTAGERAVELAANDRLLERGKTELARAIEAEKARATRALVRRGETPALRVTGAMRAALLRLYLAGRETALRETEQILGTRPAQLADPPRELEVAIATLRTYLHGISVRLEVDGVEAGAGLGTVSELALERALIRQVPGALDAASRIVSGQFATGLAAGFAPSLHDFGGWTYSAMSDLATCTVCRYYDGHRYDSWDAIQAILPDGGPNPSCHGNGRCRCRPVPEPPAAGPS